MVIDGEEVKMKCNRCGAEFKTLIGYGPVCPTPMLRRKILKENPPAFPKCGSKDCQETGLLSKLKSLFK